VIPIP